jgi:hypothetical protein
MLAQMWRVHQTFVGIFNENMNFLLFIALKLLTHTLAPIHWWESIHVERRFQRVPLPLVLLILWIGISYDWHSTTMMRSLERLV